MDCDRCEAKRPLATTTSYFNTETICMDCRRRERAHPAFKAAQDREVEAVRAGDLNFPGVGAPADLHEPYVALLKSEGRRLDLDLTPCGLNGDWSVMAFHVGEGTPNTRSGDLYILDDEDGAEDGFVLVRRRYAPQGDGDDDLLYEGDGWNDQVPALATGTALEVAARAKELYERKTR